MKMGTRVSVVLGTRPEAVKLCPVILALRDHPDLVPHVCVTGQHRQMLDQVLNAFGVSPDVDLALMQPDQSLAAFSARSLTGVSHYLAEYRPNLVLVQGDTTTVLTAALAAFYEKIPVGHVEAGLRTFNRMSPYPEEMNRVLTTSLADLHFAPTLQGRANLLAAGASPDRIYVTGNTVIDALYYAVEKVRKDPPTIPGIPPELLSSDSPRRVVLITGHRRENFGQGFRGICAAIAGLAQRFPDVAFVYPVHLNPRVREPVHQMLSGEANVYLIEPLGYLPFVALMDRSVLILTDSGGIQEEAPSLCKPVLVLRDTTERPEAVAAGAAKLVGTDADKIIDEASALLTDEHARQAMAQAQNPFGDGTAATRIVDICAEFLFSHPTRAATVHF